MDSFKPEIISALKNRGYEVVSAVGKGGYSSCLKVLSKRYNKYFVSKVIDKAGTEPARMLSLTSAYRREVGALGSLLHPNVINLYDFFYDGDYLFLIIDWCEGGSIEDILNETLDIEPSKLILYTKQLIEAFAYIHGCNIAHHDIKPANILLDSHGNLKISDFGLSKSYDASHQDPSSDFKGTMPFMAPEVIRRIPYDPFKADVWSLGITLYNMATSELPFQSKDPKILKELINLGKYVIPGTAPKLVREVIKAALIVDPAERPTMNDLMKIIQANLSTLPLLNNQTKIRSCSNMVQDMPRTLNLAKVGVRKNISFVGQRSRKSLLVNTGRNKLLNAYN